MRVSLAVADRGRGARGNLLVVDDNLDIRQALRDLLHQEGYKVECVADGEAALRRLRDGFRPRAILLDVMMQGLNGELFRSQQAADPAIADIPVIVLSANRSALEKLGSSALAVLPKPFRFEQLMQVLNKIQPASIA